MHKVIIVLAIIGIVGVASAQDLVITELMYNDNNGGGDWIELTNRGEASIDLTGMHVVDGEPGIPHATHPHCTLVGTLGVGEVLVLVADFTDFAAVYPGVSNLNANDFDPAGAGFGLGGGGDTIFILDALDDTVFTMTYDDADPWPIEADGTGPSLLLQTTGCTDFSDVGCWMAGVDGGNPGVVTGTVAVEGASWGQVKSLYR